jgi:hypothetical protein
MSGGLTAWQRIVALMACTMTLPHQVVAALDQSEMTASELYVFCTANDEASQNTCGIYILGVVQGLGLAARMDNDKTHFCFPDNLTEEQLVSFALKAMEADFDAHSEDRKLPAVSVVSEAMIHTFPCVKSN